jgi:hypothetical protein
MFLAYEPQWTWIEPNAPLTRLIYPCTDSLQLPKPYDWPAHLLEQLAMRRFDRPDWIDWIHRPVMAGGLNIYKYSTFIWANDLIV